MSELTEIEENLDILWLLLGAYLVFFMQVWTRIVGDSSLPHFFFFPLPCPTKKSKRRFKASNLTASFRVLSPRRSFATWHLFPSRRVTILTSFPWPITVWICLAWSRFCTSKEHEEYFAKKCAWRLFGCLHMVVHGISHRSGRFVWKVRRGEG